jgi:acyl dehydratase
MQVKLFKGQSATLEKSFTFEDIKLFAKLSGDKNPIHLDEEFASKTIFKKNIVHGALINSLFSNLLANQLPGNGCIYLSQHTQFKNAVFPDDIILATVEIIDLREDKPIAVLKTMCYNKTKQNIACEGEAVVKYLKN